MSWSTLDTQIYNLINDNKDDLNIQEVIPGPSTSFSGYPAITISPSDQPSDYDTNVENQRIFAFKVRIFYETENTGLITAKDNLLNVADGVIDKIDQEVHADTRTVGVDLDSKYIFIDIEPVPGAFFTIEQEHIIFLELTVSIKLSVSLT